MLCRSAYARNIRRVWHAMNPLITCMLHLFYQIFILNQQPFFYGWSAACQTHFITLLLSGTDGSIPYPSSIFVTTLPTFGCPISLYY